MDYNIPPPINELPLQEPIQNNEQIVEYSSKTFNKNIYIALGVLGVLAAAGAGVFYWYSGTDDHNSLNNLTQNSNVQQTVQNTPTENDSLTELKNVFDKLNTAKNEETFKQYLSKDSLLFLAQTKEAGGVFNFGNQAEATWVSAKISPDGKIAYVTGSKFDDNNTVKESTVIFVLEDGVWKFDLVQTISQ
jgi:hypothetical protein